MVESLESKLKRVCEARGLSIKQACELSDVTYGTLMQQLSRGSRIPHETIDDLSHGLGLPINFFSKYVPSMSVGTEHGADEMARAAAKLMNAAISEAHMQALRRQSSISLKDVLDWHDSTNGELVDFDALQDSVDLFHVMGSEDNIPNPYQIGRKSLSTLQFEIEDEAHYSKRIGEFHPALLANIKKGRLEASYHPYMLATVKIKAEVGGKWIVEKYRRLTAKVFLPNRQELTLVYAELVPNIQRLDHEATDLDLIQPLANPPDGPQE